MGIGLKVKLPAFTQSLPVVEQWQLSENAIEDAWRASVTTLRMRGVCRSTIQGVFHLGHSTCPELVERFLPYKRPDELWARLGILEGQNRTSSGLQHGAGLMGACILGDLHVILPRAAGEMKWRH